MDSNYASSIDLARYLMVSRQNLSGLLNRMERDGHLRTVANEHDCRSRLVHMSDSGRQLWLQQAIPKINVYYNDVLSNFLVDDVAHALHYLLKLLDNMKRIDKATCGRNGTEDD